MSSTILETILGGAGIAMVTGLFTKLLVSRNVVKKDECIVKQGACMALVKIELEHIKEGQKELKEGQKEGQRIVMEVLSELKGRGR